jgi:AbrB family looped-hinge helix DNA binding protein
MTTTIDHAGRVVIPKSLREQVGLLPGTQIEIQVRNGHLEIEPVAVMSVERRGRFLVAVPPLGTPTVAPEEIDEFIKDLREGRVT